MRIIARCAFTISMLLLIASGCKIDSPFTATIQAKIDEDLGIIDDEDGVVSVTGVSLNKSSTTITVGSTEQLTAAVEPADASDPEVSWSSDEESVATVDATGLVTAVAEGTATITVTTTDGEFTASCDITVSDAVVNVTGVTLDKSNTTIEVGATEQLTATVAPTDATDKSVGWSSDDESIATVDETGLVTAVAEGTAVITVTTTDGGHTATCDVTATTDTIPVTGVSLNKSSTTITVGSTEQLTAAVEPADASDPEVSWSSDAETVATVDATGLVTANTEGTAVITVTTTDGGHTATCDVTATTDTIPVTGVSLNKSSTTITIGSTEQLTATVEPSDVTDKSVSWESDNTDVASVDSTGLVTALAEGQATITVTTTDGGHTATCDVTVHYGAYGESTITINNPDEPTFSMSPTTFTLQTGGGSTEQTITVSPGSWVTITYYKWYVNGLLKGSTASISLNTDDHLDWFELGVNTLTLIVEIDGNTYSDRFFFTVVQYVE